MVRTQILLTETQYTWLKRWAQRKEISLSEAIRRCVDVTSFAIMDQEGIRTALALDPDFAENGYEVIPAL